MASFFYNIVVSKTILDIPILDQIFILMPKILVSEGEVYDHASGKRT